MKNTSDIPDVLPFAAPVGEDFTAASGPVAVRMNNDYLFRALLQRSNRVLKGLICSLLHLDDAQIHSVVITNPIELGNTISSRQFFLDVRVLLNDDTIINLEMQVINEQNWVERSLSYLCRSFDDLEHGQNYIDAKTTVQIGLLDFTLFKQHPEFYATYQLLNTKTHALYSDKLRLCVVDLTKIDMATEEDRAYHIDYWASLFKAATWEEIKMLAQKDDYIKEASDTIYQLTQEEKIRLQCEAREDYYRRQGDAKLLRERLSAANESLQTELQSAQQALAEKDSAIAALQAELQQLKNSHLKASEKDL